MKKVFIALLSVTLVLSCSKSDVKNDEKPAHQPISGMGETTGALQGTAFTLPQGVTLVNNEINGYLSGDVCKELSSGYYVAVYFVLKNTTGAAISVTFPAGLTIKALDASYQNGFVLQEETISINAGASCLVLLNGYCLNASRHASSDGAQYTWGPVTNAPEMVYLINLCKSKKIDQDTDLQGAIWSITDGDGLNDYDIQNIKSLPNK
ncbi:hypothetical protein [Niabella soli]|uniref:Uncharacterized protein n=1 Tax=Niabella soli DSM 19437 TaxID=929713 RepID=W0F3J3_9BACT|nr:hypothetical protein [Niabella soli]AHF17610.1 hypothetical protein NIASO_11040 [Niabella soli DSM 19437]